MAGSVLNGGMPADGVQGPSCFLGVASVGVAGVGAQPVKAV